MLVAAHSLRYLRNGFTSSIKSAHGKRRTLYASKFSSTSHLLIHKKVGTLTKKRTPLSFVNNSAKQKGDNSPFFAIQYVKVPNKPKFRLVVAVVSGGVVNVFSNRIHHAQMDFNIKPFPECFEITFLRPVLLFCHPRR